MQAPLTLYDLIWQEHVVTTQSDGTALLFIDRHMAYEITSPQAFERLREAGRQVAFPNLSLAVPDHGVPTARHRDISAIEPSSRRQIELLAGNCDAAGITCIGIDDTRQGIVHVVGPEQGFTLPGTTVVCGDSHTATHGAFGALAFGIGTSEVEHVLATQTLRQQKSRTMRVNIHGSPSKATSAKDIALHMIGTIGTNGATGHVIEYAGPAVTSLQMEGRMTLCNMSIEAGARAGLIAPDDVTFAWLKGRPMAPNGDCFDAALQHWRGLRSDPNATFDREVTLDINNLAPQITWGTRPSQVCDASGRVPLLSEAPDESATQSMRRSLEYMGLKPGEAFADIAVDYVFIGSCTNARLSDLRAAAEVARRGKVREDVRAIVVPGSGIVRKEAEKEGLDRIFLEAGFEWRQPGCSMCVGVNGDTVPPGARCASTTNRNFEGRQGTGARTHLMSPVSAAATALRGHLTDPREFL